MSWLSEGLKSLGSGIQGVGSSIKSGYSGIEDRINTAIPVLPQTGEAIEGYLEPRTPEIMGVGGKDLWRVFWDPSRDNPISSYETTLHQIGNPLQGRTVFDRPGDVEYNQNVAKRAAMVAAVFGGAAAAGGAGAGAGGAGSTAAAPAAGSSMLAGTSTVPVAGGFGSMSSVPMAGAGVAAPAATYGASAGATGGLGLTEAGMAGGGMAGSMAGAGGAGAAAPAVAGGGAAGGAATAGSWAPYAMAGGSILSTLFSGLMQMQQAEEQRQYEAKMARAKSNIERAQAENAALDRLIQIWGRR